MHGNIYFLYLCVKLINYSINILKPCKNISYRVIYSNFLKAFRCLYLGSNNIVVYKELFSLEAPGFVCFLSRNIRSSC